MIQAIIFDLDGTIIDTEDMWAHATKQMLVTRGIVYTDELKQEIHNKVHGLPPLVACSMVKEMFELKESVHELAREKSLRAQNLFSGNIRFIPGFIDFYQRLQKLSIKMAIATNCDDAFISIADTEVNLKYYFKNNIYGIAQVNNIPKPDPAIYLHVAKMISVNPKDCLVIEDSGAGIAAAKNAEMFCVGINTADNYDNLKEAHMVVDSYNDLYKNLTTHKML